MSLFSIVLYHNLRETLYKETDSTLILKAEGFEDALRAHWKTRKMEMEEVQSTSYIFSNDGREKLKLIIDDILRAKPGPHALHETMIYIFETNGRLVASSELSTKHLILKKTVSRRTLEKGVFTGNGLTLGPNGEKIPVRMICKVVMEAGVARAFVLVMTPLEPLTTQLTRLKKLIFLREPFILFVAGVACIILIRATLRPISQMIQTIQQVGHGNLHQRLKVPEANDEMRYLAISFNQMMAKLEKSFRSQHQMVQDISHELRTPLTVLKGQIELALRRPRSTEEYESLLRSNSEEIEKMQKIIHNLLILARLDEQGLTGDVKEVELEVLIRGIADDAQILADAKEISLELKLRPGLKLQGNEAHLRSLFKNLIENAVKYTPEKGKVTVSSHFQNDTVTVDVQDTGVGIESKHLPHIFDRFYRVDASRGSEGFGLGLSIAKSVAAAHQGDILVESEAGKGTTFRVMLPVAA